MLKKINRIIIMIYFFPGFLGALIFFSLFSPLFPDFHPKVVWRDLNWKVIHSTHFDLHYPQGYEFLGKKSMEIAEKANILISQKMKHKLSEVIPIYIYPSHGYFQMTNIIPFDIDEGIGGLTEANRKRIMVPYNGSYEELLHVLTHEIVHAFQYDIILRSSAGSYFGISSLPDIPSWVVEGMAEFYSIGWDPDADMLVRDAVLTGTMPSLFEMSSQYVISPMILYKGGQAFYQYVSQTYGDSKIPELLKNLRDLHDIRKAFKTTFGEPMEEVNRKWALWLKRLYFSDVEMSSGFEKGKQGTAHLYDKSYLNLYPSISPDGKKVAYISIRDYNPVIVIRKISSFPSGNDYDINNNEKPDERIVVRAGQSENFYQLHLLDNKITFLKDSSKIFFAARAYGKDVLYLYDIDKKKILRKWFPDVDMIQFPSLSRDEKLCVFTGSIKGKTDLFIYNLESGTLNALTSDYYTENDPVFSDDGSFIYFSGNRNNNDNLENRDYDLYRLNIKTKEVTPLLKLPGIQGKPQVLHDDPDKLLFVSQHERGKNAFLLDMKTNNVKPLTNSFNGVLSIATDLASDQYVASIYQEQGYDVVVYNKKDIEGMIPPSENKEEEKLKKSFFFPVFPSSVSFLKNLNPEKYQSRFGVDGLFFGVEYSSYYGFGGFAFFSISEYMGDQQITGIVDYIAYRSHLNFNLDYYFLKNRLNWHAGVFRATSYYSILNLLDLTSINNLIYDPNQFTSSLYRFGGYIRAEYPWTNFLRNSLGLEISRYEEKFFDTPNINYLPIQTNVFALSGSLVFNNALYSYTGPLKGTNLIVSDRQTMNITGYDHEYNSIAVDFRHYFNFAERYVFAVRASAGFITGKDSEYYFWRLGGPFSIRGYDFLSLVGKYNFLVNLELRMPLLDYFVFGFPVQWVARGFSGVAFIDFGTAFSDFNKFAGMEYGRLKDLKLSFGLGIRFILLPGLLLRFDWATPWDFKSVLPIDQWKFNFSLGYEY